MYQAQEVRERELVFLSVSCLISVQAWYRQSLQEEQKRQHDEKMIQEERRKQEERRLQDEKKKLDDKRRKEELFRQEEMKRQEEQKKKDEEKKKKDEAHSLLLERLKKEEETRQMEKQRRVEEQRRLEDHRLQQENQRLEVFVSSLLLRHLQAVSTNGLEIAECILKNNDITKFDIIPVGGAIFPTMSFFNHSCYPNALRIGYQNHQVEMISNLRNCSTNNSSSPLNDVRFVQIFLFCSYFFDEIAFKL